MAEVVVLAYSGGLDTSVALKWLQVERGFDVVALSVDVGQQEDLEAVRTRALATGAIAAEVVDARDAFADDYIARAIKADARYENRYPLVSSLSRPLISERLVEVARRYGASAVAHGCTGKGNDQVRFEVALAALAPDLTVLAPVRDWGMNREDTIEYGRAHGVTLTQSKENPYSIDQNLWGRAVECGEMEDPWAAPPSDVWAYTAGGLASLPDQVVIGFEQGVPVSLDGERLPLAALVDRLNRIAGSWQVGRIDMVENRRVGIKSREVYEAPAAVVLLEAHRQLEDITLEREVAHAKIELGLRWATLVYDGLWFSPLKHAIDAFIDEASKPVTGEVRVRFAPNAFWVDGRRSPSSLYDYELATYASEDRFRHGDAEGFVRIFGLGIRTWAERQGGLRP
ncbi:argininosuccinate synthase [Acidimicrobium ferrooxidans DSM 10331]|uniref:Argininosuccinate synthase n=1 Tax=Acidimicrobium ferrooxidans (strain DSM 10331 / JCM 15462 / NBRC 103882 / ICP) TaxID=525909 RepID=C7M0R7_ACIFD|nr:argininosuccinate synthase [Acidimicrobium ferrooxidans]ACU54575.1 argininosuccinate synthase [Acidimicrobium ferrooxidans DSM 10331]